MAYFDVQRISVATGSDDEQGFLVLAGGRLVAVLVRLSDFHDEASGHWYLEAGFGPCAGLTPAPFETLSGSMAWIADRHDRDASDLPAGLDRLAERIADEGGGAPAC